MGIGLTDVQDKSKQPILKFSLSLSHTRTHSGEEGLKVEGQHSWGFSEQSLAQFSFILVSSGWLLGVDIALPMTKSKRRQLAALEAKNDAEVEAQDVDDDWVVVKKQRIIVHIPPLPMAVKPASQKPRMKKWIRNRSRKIAKKSQAWDLSKQCLKDSRTEEEKSLVPPSKEEKQAAMTHTVNVTPDPNAADWLAKNPRVQPCSDDVREMKEQIQADGPPELAGVSKFSNRQLFSAVWSSDFCQQSRRQRDLCELGLIGGLSVGALQNQNVRAFNLERKLERAGGLSTWLVSQGLDRFIEMFRREKIDVFQLLGLTMGRLKDMGANAVGPRRKLIHAIDCLCQPYYFKVLP